MKTPEVAVDLVAVEVAALVEDLVVPDRAVHLVMRLRRVLELDLRIGRRLVVRRLARRLRLEERVVRRRV